MSGAVNENGRSSIMDTRDIAGESSSSSYAPSDSLLRHLSTDTVSESFHQADEEVVTAGFDMDHLFSSLDDLHTLDPLYGGTDPFGQRLDLPHMMCSISSLPISQGPELALSQEIIMSEIATTFTQIYLRYPLWHLGNLLVKVYNKEYLTNIDCRLELLCIMLLNEISEFRKSPLRGTARLNRLMDMVDLTRPRSHGGHFAADPSLEGIVSSLILFMAHSVCDQHNVAFYYLTEAIGLLRLVSLDQLAPIEVARYRRLESLLFITESASLLVYGKAKKEKKMIYCPDNVSNLETSMSWHSYGLDSLELPEQLSHLGNIAALDTQAVQMLCTMVQLYNATTTAEITNVSMLNSALSSIIEHGVSLKVSVQEVDVDITRQWLLCLRWQEVMASEAVPLSTRRSKSGAEYVLQIVGLKTLYRSRDLSPGDLRIVGHGKLAGVVTAMFSVASDLGILARCSSVIGDLIRTVFETDYERCFSDKLSFIQTCIQEVPRQISFNDDELRSRSEDVAHISAE